MTEKADTRISPDDVPALVEACLEGDQGAWTRLVEHFGSLVYSIPQRYGLCDADCDDIFQNVFTILVEKLSELRERRTLAQWLIVTTHRRTWRHMERAKTPIGGPDTLDGRDMSSSEAPPEALILRWERQHLVHESLAELGGPCEELLRSLFLEGDSPSYEDISRRLKIPVGSIGPRRARCIEKLIEILHDRGLHGPDTSHGDREGL